MSAESSFSFTTKYPPSDLPCLPHRATSHSVLLKLPSAPPRCYNLGQAFSHCNVHHLPWEQRRRCPGSFPSRWLLCSTVSPSSSLKFLSLLAATPLPLLGALVLCMTSSPAHDPIASLWGLSVETHCCPVNTSFQRG